MLSSEVIFLMKLTYLTSSGSGSKAGTDRLDEGIDFAGLVSEIQIKNYNL